ncbi:hypothetical protein PNIG_a0240 [Pseudoalteromonas nigrifaciens]|uniref:Uncharacterized protein n=1 Tax=Pseudoalteromonas nigrifaciens TaxID=28109 RepID=A0AAC9UF51_9GAMM|nr:hypothetical protein PNIG_a0240 [Pseudoalteromonas nigrifaciens]
MSAKYFIKNNFLYREKLTKGITWEFCSRQNGLVMHDYIDTYSN